MKELAKDINFFLSNKIYCFIVCLAAIGAYGFKISHAAIGIDDTSVPLYFQDGLAPIVGRWTLYLVNKLFYIADFAPWLTELAGVLLLIFSATVWCVLLLRLFGRKVTILGYAFFAAIFITCPLISEVYVYYLHNGIGLGYGLTAAALLLLLEALETTSSRKRTCKTVLGAAAILAVALGCYESFIIVYAMGAVLLFVFMCLMGREKSRTPYSEKVWRWAVTAVTPAILSILFRSFMIKMVCTVFQISIPESSTVPSRSSISFSDQDVTDLFMNFKRHWVKFYLNGVAYLPITVLVLGLGILLVICVIYGIKKRDIWLPAAALTLPVLPALLIFVEGKESYYRACQYVPLIGASALFLLVWIGQRRLPVWGKRIGVLLMAVLLWNQCADMNRWFYVDYRKYEYFKSVVTEVAFDLERDYDLSKPVIFRGAYLVPYAITKDAHLDFGSRKYMIIKKIGDLVDEHLIEKYNAEGGKGYCFVETPISSTLRWGITAFDGTSREIRNFMAMHGYEIVIETDLQKIEEAEKLRTDMPHFPQNGYIREYEDYIIVNF